MDADDVHSLTQKYRDGDIAAGAGKDKPGCQTSLIAIAEEFKQRSPDGARPGGAS